MSGISTGTIDFIPQMACANSQGICGFSYFTAKEAGCGEVMFKVGLGLGLGLGLVRHVGPILDGGGRRGVVGGLGGR